MLVRLEANGFRNLESLDWRPGPGRRLLLGDNGAGKTSLLEAVYVLATTRSFRTSRLADCARHGSSGFRLRGEVENDRRTRLSAAWQGGLERRVNDKPGSWTEHLAVLPVVAWTPEEAEALTGAPALRRRFLDRGVVGRRPAALAALARCRQVLERKRELLGRSPPQSELAPWNELLAAAAAVVIAARASYVEGLRRALDEVLAAAGLPFAPVTLAYRPSPRRGEEGETGILAALEKLAARERAAGLALAGPHRDELEISWGGRPLRGQVSAGERKALSLLLAAAHGRVLSAAGRTPLYLLDDADAELASGTLEGVWQVFSDARQLLASSSRPRVWEGLDTTGGWHLAGGRLSPL